jgi:WD40 repeat protein
VANVDSVTSPAISPDGKRIAYSGSIGDESLGRYAIFVAGVDGSEVTQVTSGSYGEFDPSWSPDGQFIVFSQNVSGSVVASNCCRIARVNLSSGIVTPATDSSGAVRPSYSPDGSAIAFDNLAGVWTMPSSGGPTTLRAASGYDASFSPDNSHLVYLTTSGSSNSVRKLNLTTGAVQVLYSTSRRMEEPVWKNGRIYFLEYSGDGYDGRSAVQVRSVGIVTSNLRVERSLPGRHVGFSLFNNDEMFFYRRDGLFRFYDVSSGGALPSPLLAGDGYTKEWDGITAVDLDGDGQDEMFFYRDDGLFRFYHVRPDGYLPLPLLAGDGYTKGWDAITAVDLDGDGQDEMFFYRDDGLFRFYNVRPDGSLPLPLLAGDGFTKGWDAITAVDLDGDGQDEMFFYREDGLFRFYHVNSDGSLPQPLLAGDNYTTGWDTVISVNLDFVPG